MAVRILFLVLITLAAAAALPHDSESMNLIP
jgi:hypothetical protein